MGQPNWGRASSLWFPIDTMPSSGPVLLTDETQTIQWFLEKPSRKAADHSEHERDESGAFLFDENAKGEQEPRMKGRKVSPAYWSPVTVEG